MTTMDQPRSQRKHFSCSTSRGSEHPPDKATHAQRKHYEQADKLGSGLAPLEGIQPCLRNMSNSRLSSVSGDASQSRLLADGVGTSRLGASASEHFMTTKQRDSVSASVTASDLQDDVGAGRKRRGKRIVTPPFSVSGSVFPVGNAFIAHASESCISEAKRTGHIVGYSGHMPRTSGTQFVAPRPHNHDKDYFLLPENYQQQIPGYSGRNMEYTNFTSACARKV